jgi:hypothetical protein
MSTQYEIIEFTFGDNSVVYAIKYKCGLFATDYARNPRTGQVIYFFSLEEAEREADNLLD